MSFFHQKIVGVCLILIHVVCLKVYAARWPVFGVPDKDYLIANGLIETRACPAGQGKVVDGKQIDIQAFCSTYCPLGWAWKTISNGKCYDLDKAFAFKGYEIIHFPDPHEDNDASTLNSEITASFGHAKKEAPTFQLRFTTPEEHWYCIKVHENSPFITCANDM